MLIENTELEYDEVDEVCLDRYLGKHLENKNQWAQRVWNNCKAHSEGEYISRVYDAREGQTWKERAKELWENKKNKRKIRLCEEFKVKNRDEILTLKSSSKYKTADQLYDELKAKEALERELALEREV